MKTFFLSAATLLGLLAGDVRGAEMPLAETLARTGVQSAWTGNGRDQLTLAVRNAAAEAVKVAVPAGLVAAADGEKVIVLRAAVLNVPAGGAAEVALPVAELAAKNAAKPRPFQITRDPEPRLAGLLKYLADKPDAPRPTSQLAVLALMDNVSFAQWRAFLGLAADTPPTPAEVTPAIDALGILRVIAPDKAFALGSDAELKRLALRNPWCRAKAAQLYGLTIPGSDGAVPPDIGQLLHTTPGDNCPICRPRTEMQTSPNGL